MPTKTVKPFPVCNLNEFPLKELKRLLSYVYKEIEEWELVYHAVEKELKARKDAPVKRKKK